jgi:hypothetical protein
MRAITIDMVGSALKKPAQTRVRNPAPKSRAANPTKMPGKSKTDIEAVKEYVKFFGLKISPKPGLEPIIGTKNAEWYKVFDSWKQAREFFHRARTDHWDFGHAYPWESVKKNPADYPPRRGVFYMVQVSENGKKWHDNLDVNTEEQGRDVAQRIAKHRPDWFIRVIKKNAR